MLSKCNYSYLRDSDIRALGEQKGLGVRVEALAVRRQADYLFRVFMLLPLVLPVWSL